MPEHRSARPGALRVVALATCTAALVGSAALPSPASAAEGGDAPPVFVSEIVADNVGSDEYEYVEITNTTDAPLSLDEAGIVFAYTYVDSADTTGDVPLEVDGDVEIAAHGSAVLWLSYRNDAGTLDSFARTADEFRAATGAGDDVQIARITGQAGMANGGDRGIRVSDASGVLTWSHYPSGSMAAGLGVDFSVPNGTGRHAPVLATQAPMTPGAVSEAQLAPAPTTPTPVPTETDEPETPEEPADVEDLAPDETVVTAPLQITEVLPDSANVAGSDGYEFIEVYNATSEPIDFADYAITYLYPQDTVTNTNEALWASTPRDVVIPGGRSLVLWIKNGANDALTDADFNAKFGTDLALGEDLVEIFSAGMANGSARGLDIRANTGFSVNRAYYNMAGADDVDADQGIRYTASDDLALQSILDTRAASPGRVQVDQVPMGLMVAPADGGAPLLDDRTVDEIDPAAGFTIDLRATDDQGVRTVSLELRNDVDDAATVVSLTHAGDDESAYRYTVNAADLMGKGWYEYAVVVRDGTNETRSEIRRVAVAGAETAPVRLNVADGEFVGGTTTISATGESFPPALDLTIDGATVETRASLERAPQFVFETSQTDFYFRNGVRIGEDILHIFDEGTYERTETIAVPVPLEHITEGEPLSVDVWAGTKAGPWIDEDENNDDFVISGMRLVLPDGRTLRPAGYADPTQLIQMGDSAGKHDFFASVFTLPDDAFTAVAHDWDTTAIADGGHEVAATDGEDRAAASPLVDNTAPVVTPSVEDGRVYQGEIVLDADIADGEGSGVANVVAELDGAAIELGAVTSSVELSPGDHVLAVTASDAVGNTAQSTTTFTVPDEMPGADGFAPDEGAEVEAGDVILQATVTDPMGDALDVSFLEGARYELGDEQIAVSSGETHDAGAVERDAAPDRDASAAADLVTTEGLDPVVSSSALPYYTFDVEVPADAGADAVARLEWAGAADADAQVVLYALAADGASWTEVDRRLTSVDGEEFTLTGTVPVADTARDGVVTVLVQHSEGFAGIDLSSRDSVVNPAHPEDTPRSEYDFTLAWESDTQYYNEEFTLHQAAIHDYVLGQREAQNIQYLIHTGDVVDDYDQPYQWENASPQYARLDDAGLPYGLLAGNHDVGHGVSDYTQFSAFFGEHRYAGTPWYGGSYQDNRGHYDLVSAGGVDFLMLYMGWDPQQDAIAWMNEVLARYPERVAIINLHEFMLTTGGLGPVPQQILDEVVAPNPNVKLVFSGHYHDAFTRVDEFDDDGDGVPDRKVHAMLFDYQGLPEGGQGYLRLLQFDNVGQSMRVRTYSPSLERYNSDESSLLGSTENPYEYQDFAISYADLGIAPSDKTLRTSSFSAEILTTHEIGAVADVASGSVAAVKWPLEQLGDHGWYVRTEDPYGAIDVSSVRTFTLVPASEVPEETVPEEDPEEAPGPQTPRPEETPDFGEEPLPDGEDPAPEQGETPGEETPGEETPAPTPDESAPTPQPQVPSESAPAPDEPAEPAPETQEDEPAPTPDDVPQTEAPDDGTPTPQPEASEPEGLSPTGAAVTGTLLAAALALLALGTAFVARRPRQG